MKLLTSSVSLQDLFGSDQLYVVTKISPNKTPFYNCTVNVGFKRMRGIPDLIEISFGRSAKTELFIRKKAQWGINVINTKEEFDKQYEKGLYYNPNDYVTYSSVYSLIIKLYYKEYERYNQGTIFRSRIDWSELYNNGKGSKVQYRFKKFGQFTPGDYNRMLDNMI